MAERKSIKMMHLGRGCVNNGLNQDLPWQSLRTADGIKPAFQFRNFVSGTIFETKILVPLILF
jgi:hypothetical protein